jgi:hypothetical protein
VLPRIPGISWPEAIQNRLTQAKDIEAEGVALAREIAAAVSALPGVAGVHLMLFGPDHAVLPAVIEGLKTVRADPRPESHDVAPREETLSCPSQLTIIGERINPGFASSRPARKEDLAGLQELASQVQRRALLDDQRRR